MLWKAGTVQLKNVKAKNVASYFSASQVTGSPAVTQAGNSCPTVLTHPQLFGKEVLPSCSFFLKFCAPMAQVWRLRVYKTEKVIGAAKPLLFLKRPLVMTKGQCQRIL